MVTARSSQTATLLTDGQVLIAGGWDGSGVTASAELYNPSAAGTFAAIGDMTASRQYHTATLLADGQVLLAGGRDNTLATLSSAELYNPSTGTFTVTPGYMTTSRMWHTATLLPNGQVLLAGGSGGLIPFVYTSAELYIPPDLPPGFPCFSYNPPVFNFVSGITISTIAPTSSGTFTWSIMPTLPSGLYFDVGTGIINGTPTGTSTSQTYQVSASNGTNSATAYLWISVVP